MAAILKYRYDVITPPPMSDCYEIWQLDAKWHAGNYTSVKIETASTNPIWRFPFSETGSRFISAVHEICHRNLVCK